MMRSRFVLSLLVGASLSVGLSGCVKKKPHVTPIPASVNRMSGQDTSAGPLGANALPPGSELTSGPEGTQLPGGRDELLFDMVPDRETFREQTVYFDFDRSSVKPNEGPKIDGVAAFLKNQGEHKLLVEGHCDERGTEEYNRSLGERRALAVRQNLIDLGIGADRIYTKSWGEDQPAVQGHDEGAWAKNRRCEFILLKPK